MQIHTNLQNNYWMNLKSMYWMGIETQNLPISGTDSSTLWNHKSTNIGYRLVQIRNDKITCSAQITNNTIPSWTLYSQTPQWPCTHAHTHTNTTAFLKDTNTFLYAASLALLQEQNTMQHNTADHGVCETVMHGQGQVQGRLPTAWL